MRTHFLLLLVVISTMILTGCWDQTEIEEIGFVMALGMEEPSEAMNGKKGSKQIKTTFQIAVPGEFVDQNGDGKGKAFFSLTSVGVTNFQTFRSSSARTGRKLNFEHLKAIIIHEDLVRKKDMLQAILDAYMRDHEMRRRAKVFVTEEDIREILETKLPLEEVGAVSIKAINENYRAVPMMMSPTDIGKLVSNLTKEQSFLIPRIRTGEEEFKVTGAGVFRGVDSQLVGWLGGEDMQGYNWIMGNARNAIVEVPFKNAHFVFEFLDLEPQVTYERKGERDVFGIDIRGEGVISESWVQDMAIDQERTLSKLEQAIEKAIEQQAQKVVERTQTELYTDIFKLIREVKVNNYEYWKEVKKEWDGEGGSYPKADINVQANVKIRHYMLNEGLK